MRSLRNLAVDDLVEQLRKATERLTALEKTAEKLTSLEQEIESLRKTLEAYKKEPIK